MLTIGSESQLSRIPNIRDHNTRGMESLATVPDEQSFLSLVVMYNIVPYVRANAQWGELTWRSTSQTLDVQIPRCLTHCPATYQNLEWRNVC